MRKLSPDIERGLQVVKVFFDRHPHLAASNKEIANDPKSFYAFNSGIERNGGGIRIVRQFDGSAIIERCDLVTSEVFEASQSMGNVIDDKVSETNPEYRDILFVVLTSDDERPAERFFSDQIVSDAVDKYTKLREDAFKEMLFWCRETGSLGRLVSFVNRLEDPALAAELLNKITPKEYPRVMMTSDVFRRARLREMQELLDKYASDRNREKLKERLKGQAGLAKHLWIGALAITRKGVPDKRDSLFREMQELAKQPPLPIQMLQASLHAHHSADA